MGYDEREASETPWKRGIPGSDAGGESIDSTRTKWSPPSRQQQGRSTEKKILRSIGARQHPNSGAGKIKEDGSTEEELVEVKDALKSFTLKAVDLNTSRRRAAQQGKQAMWLIQFPGFILECRIKPRI